MWHYAYVSPCTGTMLVCRLRKHSAQELCLCSMVFLCNENCYYQKWNFFALTQVFDMCNIWKKVMRSFASRRVKTALYYSMLFSKMRICFYQNGLAFSAIYSECRTVAFWPLILQLMQREYFLYIFWFQRIFICNNESLIFTQLMQWESFFKFSWYQRTCLA